MSYLPFRVTEIRSDTGKMETDIDTCTQKQAFALLHPCTFTSEHSYSHSHIAAHTHIQHPVIFPIRPQMSELSLVFYDNQEERKKK